MVLDKWQQRRSIPSWNLHQKGFCGGRVDSTKDPAISDWSCFAVGSRNDALVNLDNATSAAKMHTMSSHAADAQVSVHTAKMNCTTEFNAILARPQKP